MWVGYYGVMVVGNLDLEKILYWDLRAALGTYNQIN